MEKSRITAYVRHGCFLYDGSSCYGRRSKSSADRGGFLYSQRTLDDSLNFAFKDTAWMNAINSVTVNGTVYTNKTISSFGSDTNIWDIGSATGAYGSYTALRIVSPDTYPLTVDITAAGIRS